MSLLTLVRHGQASFLQANYDKLSEIGEQQARILGEYWLRSGATFDQVYYGPACRHHETGDAVAQVFRRAGVRLGPNRSVLPEMDEYPGIAVVREFLPGLMETHEDIRAMEREFREAGEQSMAFRLYDRLVPAHRAHVRGRGAGFSRGGELEEVSAIASSAASPRFAIRRPRTRAAVVFTSGGVIGAAVRLALDLAPQRTLEVSWTARNAGYTEFLFSAGRFSLSSFNNHPHLEDPDLLTYR